MPNSNQTITYIDLPGLGVYTDEVKKLIRQIVTQMDDPEIVTANSYLDFPVTGSANKIYVDKINNSIYRYDEDRLMYYIVGNDFHNIGLIDLNWPE